MTDYKVVVIKAYLGFILFPFCSIDNIWIHFDKNRSHAFKF